MTDKMPMNIWAWKPEILYGEFTASSTPKNPPAEEYVHKASLIEMLEGLQRPVCRFDDYKVIQTINANNKAIDAVIKKVRGE
jgi:hypothetical protein